MTTATPSEKPTNVRYGVLGLSCALSMITYLDRVCFGTAQQAIRDALGVSSDPGALKWAVTAFSISYAVFEVPSGWLGDKYGPRGTLIRIVLMWSIFTALTGAAGMQLGPLYLGLTGLVWVRFLFGMGEAGAYPNITRALHNWFPYGERGATQGLVWMSGRLMGGLTPFIWMVLVSGVRFSDELTMEPLLASWRDAFWLFGGLGVAWCGMFAWWFRDRPEQKASVNAAELAHINAGRVHGHDSHANVPWRKILGSGNLWVLCLMYFCSAYAWYFNITYLPDYLRIVHDVQPTSLVGSLYKGGPLLFGAAACLSGGLFTDWFIRRTGNRRLGRRLLGFFGHTLCATSFFICAFTHSVVPFFLAISLAAFFNDLTMGSAWATCQDIGRRYAAIAAGCMNTIGNLGGAVAGWVTGTIIENGTQQQAADLGVDVKQLTAEQLRVGLAPHYQTCFIIFGSICVVATLCWFLIDSTKPIVPEDN